MCGISIAINKNNDFLSETIIRSMNDVITHRGPDSEGFFFNNNFALGHRRLSILDLSSAGHQPMNYCNLSITYNGEVYNYIELKEELKLLGYRFNSTTDTEVILAAYKHWGVKAFEKFNGMWAFAIYDVEKNEIIFCRDRFGIKPLYYTNTENHFLAGSEIKQFVAVKEFCAKLNKRAAINFLIKGLLNYSEETFFENVNELRPGHYLKYNISTHHCTITKWYDLDKSSVLISDDFKTAVKKVKDLFVDSIKLRMRSDVRVGSCLSGGIDSSSIVCVIKANQLANKDFATITSCYKDKLYDEQNFSDAVNKKTGYLSVKVFPELNDLLDMGLLDNMIYQQDQPFSGASHYSEYNVFKKAKEENIIVMQDGQGSDEYLCGYGEFIACYISELLRKFNWLEAFHLLKCKAQHNRISLIRETWTLIKSTIFIKLKKTIWRKLGKSENPWLSPAWQQIGNNNIVDFDKINIRDLSIAEINHSSIPYQLHSEDRNSMTFSIESRLPFLDHRLVEYVIGLPNSYKIRDGYSKFILREAMDELPDVVKYRKDKMGFVAPDAPWLKENKVRVRAELQLMVSRTGIFTDDLVVRFDKFVSGELGYEPIYFRAMAFSRFINVFNMKID
jgi:asparagine synthase (glutamine-hydrolysing)